MKVNKYDAVRDGLYFSNIIVKTRWRKDKNTRYCLFKIFAKSILSKLTVLIEKNCDTLDLRSSPSAFEVYQGYMVTSPNKNVTLYTINGKFFKLLYAGETCTFIPVNAFDGNTPVDSKTPIALSEVKVDSKPVEMPVKIKEKSSEKLDNKAVADAVEPTNKNVGSAAQSSSSKKMRSKY